MFSSCLRESITGSGARNRCVCHKRGHTWTCRAALNVIQPLHFFLVRNTG
jgi:hypothetical protein